MAIISIRFAKKEMDSKNQSSKKNFEGLGSSFSRTYSKFKS